MSKTPAAIPLSTSLVGTWSLVSRIDRDAGGAERDEPSLGQDPIALLFYDRGGNFAAQFMKRDRTTGTGTAGPALGNNTVAVGGYDAYFGTYTVDDERGTVTQTLAAALSPENVGLVVARDMVVDDDRLTITIAMTDGDETITRILTWTRVG